MPVPEPDAERPDNEGTLAEPTDITDSEPGSWGPMGPDGGPSMGIDPPPSTKPTWSPQVVPCLRACRHLMQTEVHFDHGNAPGTLEAEPRSFRPLCTRIPGVFLELSRDAPVLECSAWDPLDAAEQIALDARRTAYLSAHPDHDPAVMDADIEASASGGNGGADDEAEYRGWGALPELATPDDDTETPDA